MGKYSIKNKKTQYALNFFRKYYLILILVVSVGFVGAISIYKLYIQKPTYIYVKVKVGQGFWWASTQKPVMWYIKAIQDAKKEVDLMGKPIAEIIRVSYYPWYGSNSFDVFVIVRLQVTKVGDKGYNFKRETLGISGPIDLEFKNVQFSGTIVDMSTDPIAPITTKKVIYLSKKYTYPWEYDAIQVGDYFNDGNSNVIEILDKAKGETNDVYVNEAGKLLTTETETYRYILLKVSMRVRETNNQLLYGEEIIVSPGRVLGFVTNGFTFNDYVVSKIE